MKSILIILCFVFGHYTHIDGAKNALLNPPWTHCIIQLHALPNKWEELTSPGFPGGITRQTQCTWIISSNPNQRIRLAFQTLNLTGSVDNCYTQFLQIMEIKAVNGKHDRGKFCGDRRPGDYVSYGYQLRLDLMADTAAAGHQGFQIKYKAVKKDPPGFKSVFSFTNKKPKPKSKPKKKKNKPKTTTSPKKNGGNSNSKKFPPSTSSNGGKVNLNSIQKQREKIASKPKFVGNNTRIPVKNINRRPPNQYVDTPIRDKRPGKTTIVINDGEKEPEFNIYLVVGIPVGGLIIIILIGVAMKLCIFDKRKKQKKQKKKDMEYEKKNQFSPLNAGGHPIQRLHHLPGAVPTQPGYNPNYIIANNQQYHQELQQPPQQQQLQQKQLQLQQQQLQQQQLQQQQLQQQQLQQQQLQQQQLQQQQLQNHDQENGIRSSVPSSRAPKAQAPLAPPNRSRKTPSPISMINDDVILGNDVAMGDEARHHVDSDQVVGEQMYTNDDGGFVFYYPANQTGANTMPPNYNAVTSLNWHHQNGTTEMLDQDHVNKTLPVRTQSKRSVPTLKRKISQWEKSEIKKGNYI